MSNKVLGIVGWIVALGTGIAVIGLAIFIVFALISEDNVEEASQEKVEEVEESAADHEAQEREQESIEEEVQEVVAEEMLSESAYMDTLHKMTHQKVYADEKWGAVEITEERVDLLWNIARESEFSHRDFYMETLNAWKDGDFNNVVQVHNFIWEIQNGSIGRATRPLTEEEEQQYVEKYFE